jgi:hypothetical protein
MVKPWEKREEILFGEKGENTKLLQDFPGFARSSFR